MSVPSLPTMPSPRTLKYIAAGVLTFASICSVALSSETLETNGPETLDDHCLDIVNGVVSAACSLGSVLVDQVCLSLMQCYVGNGGLLPSGTDVHNTDGTIWFSCEFESKENSGHQHDEL